MKNTIMLSCREDEHLHKRMSDGKTFDKGPALPATNGSRRWGLFLRLRKSHSQSSISRLSLRMHHAYIIYKTWIHYEIRHTHTRTRTIAAACWSHEVVRAAQLLCPEERDKEASDCAVTTAPHVPESCTPMFASRLRQPSASPSQPQPPVQPQPPPNFPKWGFKRKACQNVSKKKQAFCSTFLCFSL